MLKEFREFAMRGNVVDMAVGIIIGAAFGRIVSSFVNDVLMPPLGLVIGNVDFSNLFINLGSESFASVAAAEEAGAPILKYGVFAQTVLDFVIVAAAIFMAIKAMNKMKRQAEAEPAAPPAPPEPSEEVKLLAEIRDALKQA